MNKGRGGAPYVGCCRPSILEDVPATFVDLAESKRQAVR